MDRPYQPESLTVCSIYALVKQIIVTEKVPPSHVHQILPAGIEDDIERLIVNCPGNRFDVCTGWQNFHVSCFVSRAYQMLWDEFNNMELMCRRDIEKIRNKVEQKFKSRLVSFIDLVNRTRDQRSVCARNHIRQTRKCLVCFHYMVCYMVDIGIVIGYQSQLILA